MDKLNVVLVILNRKALESVVSKLNLNKANPVAIITDCGEEEFFTVGEEKVPFFSFLQLQECLKKNTDCLWLLGGYLNSKEDLFKLRKFLTISGVPEENIINFETTAQISETWLANVHHVEEYGADFFATGNEYMRDGLNLKFIPRAQEDKISSRGGANLCYANQDLQQSYQIAQYVFEHAEPGTIKFVLIGLTPDSLQKNNKEDIFRVESLDNPQTKNIKRFQLTFEISDNDCQTFSEVQELNIKYFIELSSFDPEQEDLNFGAIKKSLKHDFSADAIIDWEGDKQIPYTTAEKNIHILKDYIQLCLDNGAKPIGVVFPFASVAKEAYNKETIKNFREIIHQLEMDYDFICVDMFDLDLDYDRFCDMKHLNLKGMLVTNSLLSLKLYEKNLIPAKSFCAMTYEYFYTLSSFSSKDDYNNLIEKVFAESVRLMRRRKGKIKICFVTYDDSTWCGDDLYNFFANDERFEPTVLLCLRADKLDKKLVQKNFQRGVEQLRSHGLNVIAVEDLDADIPAQDAFIFLMPYLNRMTKALRPSKLKLKTLIMHIPYSLDISVRGKNYYNYPIFRTAWRVFFSSVIGLEVQRDNCSVGMPRGMYSGYPRMDVFFNSKANFHFDWKMARPNAKKIIWAPHHSITGVNVEYSTFQWNYKFMYEFAKSHPETSWVVKPHPNLFFRAVSLKIFPSDKAFEKYLQAWNDLPNAQVYLGAYYQDIFATSDGMIHDSGSFIAEYQYVDKPMIYLTRDTQKFNELANEILNVSYTVDGKDLDAIATLMQRVFIEGDDYKAAERREIFDKYLNYPKYNGMLASEFIYKTITKELKAVK